MDVIYYYSKHVSMTEMKNMKHMVSDIPKDIRTIVSYVQHILLHEHWVLEYWNE